MGYKIPRRYFIYWIYRVSYQIFKPYIDIVAQHGEIMGEIAAEMLIEKVRK